jgi:hypothetical protein
MRHSQVALVSALMISAAFGQETVTLPAKPANPQAGRVLALREAIRISDAQGGFYFKGPSRIQAVPGGGLLVADEDELLRFDAAGKFVVNMYRRGQGPGELRQITDFLVRGAEVLAFQEQPMKCVVSGLDGKFLQEFKPDVPVSRLLGLYGDRLLLASNTGIPFDKVKKPEGDILDIVWTLALASPEGAVKATSLAYPTTWFAKRLPGAMIADYLTFLLCAPLADGLVAVANDEAYVIHIADPAKDVAVRTIPTRSAACPSRGITTTISRNCSPSMARSGPSPRPWSRARGSSSTSSAPAATISTASTFPCQRGSACTIWPAIP